MRSAGKARAGAVSPKASATGWPVVSPDRPRDRVAPPLQANLAELRLAHLLGDAGKLDIEGIKGEESAARIARGANRALA